MSSNPSRTRIVRLAIVKLDKCLYEYSISDCGVELYRDAGFASIADAIRGAAEGESAFLGYEVAFGGVTGGTYPAEVLGLDAVSIADNLIETLKNLHS